MEKKTVVLASLWVLLFSSLTLFAQNQVDLTFNAAPSLAVSNTPNTKGQVAQADGKVVVWGGALAEGSLTKGVVARLNADGSLDTSFNFCGCSLSTVTAVLLLPDGKMLVSGSNSFNRSKEFRIYPDGSLDVTYSSPFTGAVGSLGISARVRAVQPDNYAIIETINSDASSTLGRYQPNGLVDNSFTPIAIGNVITLSVPDIVIAPGGKIYIGIGGIFTTIGTHTFSDIKRYNSDGTIDDSWPLPSIPQDTGVITGLDIQADGSIIVSGLTSINGVSVNNIARILPAGNVDLTFAASGFTSISQVKVLSSGKILISAVNGSGQPNRIFRLNSDGSTDDSLVKQANKIKGSAEVLDADSAADKGSVRDDGFVAVASTAVLDRFTLDGAGNVVFFGQSDNVQQFYRLESGGTFDPTFDSNLAEFGKVSLMLRQPDGKVVIYGTFITVNGIAKSKFARLNSDGSLDTGFNAGSGFVGNPSFMITQADGKILAMGDFTSYNGTPVSKLLRLNSDGSLDTGFIHHVLITINTIVLQADGKLLVGGSGVVRLNTDGSTDNTFNVTFGSPSIAEVVVQSNGKIVVGGTFGGVNGFSRTNLVRLNSDGTLDATYNPVTSGGGFSSLWIQPDDKILAGRGGNSNPITLNRLNLDGSVDAGFSPVNFNSTDPVARIYDVAIRGNGDIFVGGNMRVAGQPATANFVWLNSAGKVNPSIFPDGVNGVVKSLDLQPDGKLLMAGDFTRIDTTPRAGVARVSLANFHGAPQFDFDGDGKADISIFRPSDGNWYLAQSSAGFLTTHWGQNGDHVVAVDYDGDGKTDLAVYRNGQWWYVKSTTGAFAIVGWGTAADTPLPSDFDGDGKADFVFFQPTTGLWVRMSSSTGIISNIQFGLPGDIPLIADFDGDGKADPTIFRPSTGVIWYASSVNGLFYAHPWGLPGDVPVLGDYDGDGKTDPAVFRPSEKIWYIMNSHDGSITKMEWGFSDDRPVPADYDGDGKTDMAIYRPSNGMWFMFESSGGPAGLQFGSPTDKAVPNAYIP
jgi:uncharacterized delta-60 repeat protein